MKINSFWESFIKMHPKYKNSKYDSWSYGVDADILATLTVNGIKTATSSLFDLYELENETIPEIGSISIILDATATQPICIVQTVKVSIVPFDKVTYEHAYKEGEGDRSLEHWRKVHIEFFNNCVKNINVKFTNKSLIVLEEFRVLYPTKP